MSDSRIVGIYPKNVTGKARKAAEAATKLIRGVFGVAGVDDHCEFRVTKFAPMGGSSAVKLGAVELRTKRINIRCKPDPNGGAAVGFMQFNGKSDVAAIHAALASVLQPSDVEATEAVVEEQAPAAINGHVPAPTKPVDVLGELKAAREVVDLFEPQQAAIAQSHADVDKLHQTLLRRADELKRVISLLRKQESDAVTAFEKEKRDIERKISQIQADIESASQDLILDEEYAAAKAMLDNARALLGL